MVALGREREGGRLMTCRRAEALDPSDFWLGSDAAEWQAFRRHYPDCADCAATVARWAALEVAVDEAFADEAGAEFDHPDPARLEAFVASAAAAEAYAGGGRDGDGEGDRAMHRVIERHLASCSSCRTEVALMQRFDPAQLLVAPVEAAAAATDHSTSRLASTDDRVEGGVVDGLRSFLGSMAEALFEPGLGRAAIPALVAAILVLAGLWWSGALGSRTGVESPATPGGFVEGPARDGPVETQPDFEVREPRGGDPGGGSGALVAGNEDRDRSAVEGDESPRAEREGTGLDDAGAQPLRERVAERTPVSPRPGDAGESQATERRDPVQIAEAEDTRGATAPVEEAVDETREPREELLLAALDDMPLPDYASPQGTSSAAWMRQFGPVRSGTSATRIETRAPSDHTGLTLAASPRLWWWIADTTDLPLQLTVVDEEAIEPLLRLTLRGPHAAGLHSLDLAAHDVVLKPGIDYRWFVSLQVDPNRPSRNPVSAGGLRVVDGGDERRSAVREATASARGHRLAELGIWYDAFDFFASLAEANPDAERVAAYRDRLAELARPGR